MSMQDVTHAVNVRLSDREEAVIILDQTLLPGREEYLTLSAAEDLWEAIYSLRVRGAPAIGIAAAYGAYLGAKAAPESGFEAF